MPPSPVEELALLDLDRSNKGASKQRRDQINAEIAMMRDLLPLPETARQRLSQLQVMSLSCVYIRKCNVLQKLFRSYPTEKDVPSMCDFFQALTGFLLIITREGKLVYISENVTDYLGHSMVDMKTQGDSLYDIVDKRDHGTVQAQLLQGGAEPDVTRDVAFFCRMNMSRTLKRQAGFGDVKVMNVRGHFIPLSDSDLDDPDVPQQQGGQQQGQVKYVFMATCSPLITPELKETLIQSNTMVFKTVHGLDMTYMEVTKTAEHHLGYTTDELTNKSWYSMLHPQDCYEAREKHVLLIRSSHEMGCMMTVRMLTAGGATLYVNVVMHVRQAGSAHNDDPLIVCINQVISEEEAMLIKHQREMFSLYPARNGEMWTGLTSTPTMPQPAPQPETCWVAPSATNTGYPSPVASYFMNGQQQQQQHSSMPTCTTTTNMAYQPLPDAGYMHPHHQFNSSPSSSSSSTCSNASPPHILPPLSPHGAQTQDKLKLMLKRKLQGPCRPAKIPKVIWDDHYDGGMDFAASGDAMHSSNALAAHYSMGGSDSSTGINYCWPVGPQAQAVGLAQYRMAHVMPAAVQRQVKSAMLPPVPVYPGALSPPLSTHSPNNLSEQVVPESVASVPESYLTPDPSPASSPHPYTAVATAAASVKIEPADLMKKLASLAQAPNAAVTATSTLPQTIKTEKMSLTCQQRRKELPIMDASDIESFFDTLGCLDDIVGDTKRQELVSNTLKVPQQAQVSRKTLPVTAMQQLPVIKQEPVDTEAQFPVVSQQVQPQPLTQPQPAVVAKTSEEPKKPVPSPQMEPCDTDLLNYFSGEMGETFMDFSHMSTPRDEADLLVESAKAMGQDYSPCSHDAFLSGCVRPMEDFSPSSNGGSDMTSDLSGDEDSRCFEDSFTVVKQEERRGLSGTPAHIVPSPYPLAQPPTPQEVLGEEDELHQLQTIMSTILSGSGLMLSENPQ